MIRVHYYHDTCRLKYRTILSVTGQVLPVDSDGPLNYRVSVRKVKTILGHCSVLDEYFYYHQ